MNTKPEPIPTEFGPETRFEIKPIPGAPFRAVLETEFERLKFQLLRRRLETNTEPHYNSQVRSAANEAAALAWITAYPLLVFPELFEEKANAAQAQAEKQETVFRETQNLILT